MEKGRGAVDSAGMGFISPAPPPFDIEEWRGRPHLERIKSLAQDWALNGFGTPYAVYLLYVSSWSSTPAAACC